ncbi:uncharacterized protein [Nothobranchius furzeri]|uniref:uncharacterized protein isoform X4 n=1 Tax=Nothobranchius furzeri TaxID=105023 RepID=UPI003904999A
MHSVISTWGCLRHGLYAGGICLGPKPTSRRTPSEGRQNLPNSGRLLEPGFGTVHGIYYWERLSEDCGGSCTKTEKMFTLLTSMSWPPGGIHKSTCCVACRRVAAFIDSGFWKEKTGRDLEFFPQQFMGNCCGTFMLMYALCICTSSPPSFTEEEMPAIRLWWCIQLMERFGIEGHGQRFAFWTEEASLLLQGTLQPVFRVPKATSSKSNQTVTRTCPHEHIGRGCSSRRGYSDLQTGSGVLHAQRPCVY